MREITEETYNLLKSQNMLAQNKYNYEMKLEGVEQYGDVVGTFENGIHDNAGSMVMDFVIRNDGKVFVMYNISENIYYKVLNNEQELLSTNKAIEGGTLFYTIQSPFSELHRKRFSLLKLRSGKIMVFIYEVGIYGSIPHSVKIYESNSGLGTDLEYKRDLIVQERNNGDNTWARGIIGNAIELANGDLLLSGNISYYNYSTFNVHRISVYKSTDGGITWVRKYGQESTFNRLFRYGNFVQFDNVIFCNFIENYYSKLLFSSNYGETWTYIDNAFPAFFGTGFANKYTFDFLKVGTHLYQIRGKFGTNDDPHRLFKYKGALPPTYNDLNNVSNWDIVYEKVFAPNDGAKAHTFRHTPRGNIIYGTDKVQSGVNPYTIFGVKLKEYSAPLNAISINISKGRGGSNTLNIAVDNTNGRLNPNNPDSDLYGIIGLNKQVILKQGYGEELVEVFTGLIDSFDMKSFPHVMDISCRDLLKMALDQTVTELASHTLYFENQPLETIFSYLCYLAGLETGEIEATGINITKEFSWQSYADAFQFLADLASFEYGADEYGKIYFRRDFQPDDLAIAYTFEEGQDITSLQYQLSDADLFAKVVVYGKSGEDIIAFEAPFLDAAKYNILPQKIMKIDATEASTIGELQKIANRAIYLMNSRTAVVRFSAIAVPWLQIGDFIQVNETSSRSAGIYRIVNMSLKMDDKSFLMDLECYYYGDSINPGTLPEDTATQTPNASLNLIPEMTSNTTPQGVARASSVLALYNNDYQPWNALNSTSDDLYWNASAAYGWIEYQFAEKTIIDKYMLKARQDTTYNKAMPKNWTFEAFDGEKWIVLDTRTNQINWGVHEERSYNFTNTTAYSKYRLNVSANNGYTRLQLEQLSMYYRGGV